MDAEMKGYRTGINDGKERSSGPDWLRYADIIDKQHHVSKKHPPMSMEDRAAQFSPFAALTGYEAAVKETARLTEEDVALTEYQYRILNEKMAYIVAHMEEHSARLQEQPEVMVTYFAPDERKTGGARQTYRGRLRKIDRNRKMLIMVDQTELPIENLLNIECE